MESTYTAQQAWDTAIGFARTITIPSASQIILVDSLYGQMWRHYPWDWTKENLTAISLADDTQDYAIDAADTDFRRLTEAHLTRTAPCDEVWGPLNIVDWLAPEVRKLASSAQRSIAYVRTGGNLRLRLESRASVPTGDSWQIDGEYWKNPTKITALTATFDFPDEFFQVFVDGLLQRIYLWADDPRAGTMQVNRAGNRTYTGQLAVYMDQLNQMAADEDNMSQQLTPYEPLGVGSDQFNTLFP